MDPQDLYPDLAVVIPALNEAGTIAGVIAEARLLAGTVVIVDDGSVDGTGNIAASLGTDVVRHEKCLGYDAALASGLNFAFTNGAVAAVTCDADGQHRAHDIRLVSEKVIEGGFDFCAGIRNHTNRPIEALLGVVSKPLFGTRDPFCGLKCYHRNMFERFGRFPSDLNVGTLPLAWMKKSDLKGVFIPIRVNRRRDHPRFGRRMKTSWIFFRAFYRSASYFFKS